MYEYKTVTSGTDLAENYPVNDPSISAGDIVSIDTGTPITVGRALKGDDRPLAGIISTQPGLLLTDATGADAVGQRPVALSGRVPTKVNLENGPIAIGDRIALSLEPGVGKKATLFEDFVGIAIESFGEGDEDGMVTVFINIQRGINLDILSETLWGKWGLATSTTILSTTTASTTDETASTTSSIVPLDFVGSLLQVIVERLHNFGIWISEGMTRFANLVALQFTVGSREQPTGITLYDEETGDPYCVKVKNGALRHAAGECGDTAVASSTPDISQTAAVGSTAPDSSSSTTTSDTNADTGPPAAGGSGDSLQGSTLKDTEPPDGSTALSTSPGEPSPPAENSAEGMEAQEAEEHTVSEIAPPAEDVSEDGANTEAEPIDEAPAPTEEPAANHNQPAEPPEDLAEPEPLDEAA